MRALNTRSLVRMSAGLLACALGCGCSGPAAQASPLALVTQPSQDQPLADRIRLEVLSGDKSRQPQGFVITGFTDGELSSLTAAAWDAATWSRVFAVGIRAADSEKAGPALPGKYEVTPQGVQFTPRYAPMQGARYELTLDIAQLPAGIRPRTTTAIVAQVAVPQPDGEPTSVQSVYPSADELPENLLKFYLHFSAPMGVGDSYQHIKLVEIRPDDSRQEVELPFLTLEQELWDAAGTRLTLLFDPGRIKRGLKPREEVGPSLEEGKTYELVISPNWPDVHGKPLAKEFRKRFHVLPPDDVQPDPASWQITAPPVGSRDPLVVTFAEPLDHAMLGRVLLVRDAAGTLIAGEIAIAAGETVWKLSPAQPWAAGDYQFVVETTLEDRAGNSIGRPFEVDVFNQIDRGTPREFATRRFTVGK